MFGKFAQRRPFGRVHVNVFFIGNVFLVELVDLHLFLSMARLQQLQKVLYELVTVLVDVFLRILADDEHLAHVAFGLGMHLESVGIAALLFADLAVPS